MVYRTVGEQISEETFVIGSLKRVWDTCHSPQSLLTAKEREIIGAASKIWVFGRARINGAVPKFRTILLLYMNGTEKVFMVQSRSLLSTKRSVLLCPV